MSVQIPVSIDRTSPVPLYHQLAQQLTHAIDEGVLQPGDPFENELALAERLDLSRPTVRRAIAELVNRGLLVRRRGIGTTVASRVIHRRQELTSLLEDLASSGRKPSTKVLQCVPAKTDDRAAEILGLPVDTPLVFIERLRSADGQPIAMMRNWLPPAFADITADDLSEHGLYELMRAKGIQLAVAHQTIGARRPHAAERRLLKLSSGDPVLTMTRTTYDATGVAVEFGDHAYRYDQHAFDVTVHAR
ncbi:MAG: GntR family transcriptional regulator [Micropruina sp.]|nr:MAG: GntR family transcriptional regulator [Micropruina sp.]